LQPKKKLPKIIDTTATKRMTFSPSSAGRDEMDWASIDGLSSLIRNANWGIASSVLLTFLFTVVVIVADKKREGLTRQEELAKKEEIAGINKLAGDANERAGKLEKEAADLTAQNLRLEAAIAPRRLSGRQEKELASLTTFARKVVAIKSYSSDTEGLVLATQIVNALTKAGIRIEDNRLTLQPAGSVSFGVSVDGTDKTLVEELKKVLALDGDLIKGSSVMAMNRGGVSMSVGFGVVSGGQPPAGTIIVGAKPIK